MKYKICYLVSYIAITDGKNVGEKGVGWGVLRERDKEIQNNIFICMEQVLVVSVDGFPFSRLEFLRHTRTASSISYTYCTSSNGYRTVRAITICARGSGWKPMRTSNFLFDWSIKARGCYCGGGSAAVANDAIRQQQQSRSAAALLRIGSFIHHSWGLRLLHSSDLFKHPTKWRYLKQIPKKSYGN